MVVDAHPSEQLLCDYALGRLPEHQLAEVETHIETCDGCQETLATLPSSADPLLNDLAGVEFDEPFAGEPELAAALMIARQCSLAEPSAASADEFAKLAGSGSLAPSLSPLRDYQLLAQLGCGGMGVVYEARHTRLDRLVAIKVLPTDRMRRANAIERFAREMRAVGRLDHPNIVRAFDAGEVDGKHFLVMELIDGVDLSALVNRLGPLPVADACELIRQAALGLDYAHRHGLIHRDVKPSNLILGRDGVVRVLDLGLARLVDEKSAAKQHPDPEPALPPRQSATSITNTNHALGTPDYMAPEQLSDGSQADGRSDIYSLGATLYRLLAGRPPYSGVRYDTFAKKLNGLAADNPLPIASYRQDLRQELVELLARMLARNPDERPATPGDVATAIARFARGHQICTIAFGKDASVPTNALLIDKASPSSPWRIAFVGLSVAFVALGVVVVVTPSIWLTASNGRSSSGQRLSVSQTNNALHPDAPANSLADPPRAGTWELTLPAGFVRPVQLLALADNEFVLRRFGAADGVYRWDGRRLVITKPNDPRYAVLTWARVGDELVVVDEPPEHPTGASYLGARMRFLGDEQTIPATREPKPVGSER